MDKTLAWRGRFHFFGRFPAMNPNPNSAADAELMQAVAQRDETAFDRLYEQFSRPVFSMVVRIVRSHAEAEEILQEAFWQVWQSAVNYQPALGTPFTWIVTIARRKAIDRLRANSRHLQRIVDAMGTGVDDDVVAPAGLTKVVADERALAVRTALKQLGVAERRTIELAFFDGLTHPEIAEALKQPVGTVKARIRRGLLKLQTALARQRRGEELL